MTPEEELDKLLRSEDKSKDEKVKEILQTHLQSSSFNINWKKDWNWTFLHNACLYNRYEMVFELLKYSNINPNIQDDNRWTPLHIACFRNNRVESVKLLLDDVRVDVNIKDNCGKTPLMLAAHYDSIAPIEYILASLRADIALIPSAIETAKKTTYLTHKNEIISLLEAYLSQPVATANKLRKKLKLGGKKSHFSVLSFYIHLSK
jgi:ankyrin repeat protein